jgi:hypothetical protein
MATQVRKLRAFWNDQGKGPDPGSAQKVSLREAGEIWTDVRGVEGNFFGLIDDSENTIQFLFEESIPDDVDDAGHLKIVVMDFPKPEKNGSYATLVTISEVHGLIEKAFNEGVDHRKCGKRVRFSSW